MAQEGRPGRVPEGHILQGEFMGGRRHLLLQHHLLPGREAQVPHGKALRADPFALTAQGA